MEEGGCARLLGEEPEQHNTSVGDEKKGFFLVNIEVFQLLLMLQHWT